jgi:AcrR family transcriptional regulator
MARSSARRRAASADVQTRTLRPYAGLAPEQRKEARRARLLEAGLDLFGTLGYVAVSIERLCAQANVANRHFYDEFDGREDLLRAVYDSVIDRAKRAVLDSLRADSGTAHEGSRRGIEAFLHAYLDDPRNGRIACIEVVGVSNALENHRRGVMHDFASIIDAEAERWARDGGLSPRDFSWTAIALTGATNELCIEWLLRERPPPISVLCDELLSVFFAVLDAQRDCAEMGGHLHSGGGRSIFGTASAKRRAK